MRPVKNMIHDPQVGQKYIGEEDSREVCSHDEVEIVAVNMKRRTLAYKYLTGTLSSRSYNKYEKSIEAFLKCTTLKGGA